MKEHLSLIKDGVALSNEDVAAYIDNQMNLIRNGEYGQIKNVYMIIENEEGRIFKVITGKNVDGIRFIGILNLAASYVATGQL